MREPHDPNRFWFLVDASPSIPREKPVSVQVLGKRLVIFRDRNGKANALEDRCLHRHVSLSRGRVENGCVVCPYHGLAFDGSGACVVAPPLVDASDRPQRRIPTYATVEVDDCVWVNMGSEPAPFESPWPSFGGDASSYKSFEIGYTIASSVESILENFVDTSHTGELHRGYFRGAARRVVEVVVKRTGHRVSVETHGEGSSDSILSRLLNPGGDVMEHVDRYVPPYAVRVDYRLGPRHIVTTSVCRPIAPFETFVLTRVYLRAGRLTPALLPVLKKYTKTILTQDVELLADHARQVQRFDHPKDVALKTDVGVVAVLRAYHACLSGEPGPEEEIVRSYSMRL